MNRSRTGPSTPTHGPPAAERDEPLLAARSAVPRPPTGLVERPRLLDLVQRGVEGPLTLLCAPAGAGKTVLVSCWASQDDADRTLAWLTMDKGDERPGAFWSYVVEGLGRAGLDIAGVGLPVRADSLDRALLNRLAQSIALHPLPVVLVVDAGAQAGAPWPDDDIDYLIRSAGSNLHVVLLARSDPALSLHLYRLAGTITEIRLVDLRFDESEARRLMEVSGVDLTEAQIAALVARTGGWAAGLKFAAMAAAGREHPDQALDDFTGNDVSVSDYLAREVLETQPPEMREVLLRTSIVDELTPELCELLTGRPDGVRLLQLLAHGNSFIQHFPGSYRYQSLFREFLRAQLSYEQPALVPELHSLAADWHYRNGLLDRAVRHAVAAGAWGKAAKYVVDDLSIGALLSGMGDPGMAELFRPMPSDVEGVAASLVRAGLAVVRRDGTAYTMALQDARDQLVDAPSTPAVTLFSLAFLELLASAVGFDVDAGLALVRPLERQLLDEVREPAEAHPEIGVLISLCAGRLLFWAGDFDQALAVLARAADVARGPQCQTLRLECLGLSALVEAVNGRLRRATSYLATAEVEGRDHGIDLDHRASSSMVARAWVATDELRLSDARTYVGEAEVASTGRSLLTTTLLGLVRARLLRAGGDFSEALVEVEAAREASDGADLPVWLHGLLVATEANLAVAAGRPDEAVALLQTAGHPEQPETALALDLALLARDGADGVRKLSGPPPGPGTSLDNRVTTGLVGVLGNLSTDDSSAARTALEATLRLAAPELLRRPFAEAPAEVQRMLHVGGVSDRHRWLSDALALPWQQEHQGSDSPATRTQQGHDLARAVIVEPLTPKELEVLGHLAELLTTDEIASTMFISVNTVRTHVRSILRKLGASRRNEAIRQAWELNLIPAPLPSVPAPVLG